jgi:hypothetical protein
MSQLCSLGHSYDYLVPPLHRVILNPTRLHVHLNSTRSNSDNHPPSSSQHLDLGLSDVLSGHSLQVNKVLPPVYIVPMSCRSWVWTVWFTSRVCPFTDSHDHRTTNLGELHSHNDEKPIHCKWPGCGQGFARQLGSMTASAASCYA